MRRLLVAGFIAVATQSTAFAADLPILRGALREPAPACCQTVWQGFYVGGQAGYGSSSMGLYEFSPVPTSNAIWPFLYDVTHRTSMFGALRRLQRPIRKRRARLRRQLHARNVHGRRDRRAHRYDVQSGQDVPLRRFDDRKGLRHPSRARWLHHGQLHALSVCWLRSRTRRYRAKHNGDRRHRVHDRFGTTPRTSSYTDLPPAAAWTGCCSEDCSSAPSTSTCSFTSTANTSIHSVRGGVGYKF